MKNKFIYRSKLSKWNIITIAFYILLSFFLLSYVAINKKSQDILFLYGLSTQLFLYSFQYRALRNFNYFLIWVAIGVIHFCAFLVVKNSPEIMFDQRHLHVVKVLRSTLISLLLFQLLRFLSLKIQNKELIMPAKNGGTDLYDDRKGTIFDVICFFVFLGVTVLAMTI